MVATHIRSEANRLWPRSTGLFLLLVGLVLGVGTFIVVLNMPQLAWETGQDAVLRASYDAYNESGLPLVERGAQGSIDGGTTARVVADPGVVVVAQLMSHVTAAASPYPGLALSMAILVALPLVWLPTSVARIFKRARAGYALILLPPVIWLLNQGTILVGTEYGLAEGAGAARVTAMYGLPASLAFLSLALLLHLSTFRLRRSVTVLVSLGIAILAGVGNLMLAFSGVGVAVAAGVLWWLNCTGRWRWLGAVVSSAVAVSICMSIQAAGGGLIHRVSAESTHVSAAVSSESTWTDLYLGLGVPGVSAGDSSSSLHDAQRVVAEVDPLAEVGTAKFDAVVRDLSAEAVGAEPWESGRLYLAKALFVIKQFGAMFGFVIVAYVIALMRRSHQRRAMGAALVIALPTLLIGLARPVVTSPDLNHFTEMSAALGLLVVVSLGALVWSLTSMPSHVRATERNRLSGRIPVRLSPRDERSHTSVVVPTRNGQAVIEGTLRELAGRLRPGDEIIVVENGSSDETTPTLERVAAAWDYDCKLVVLHSGAGLGEALRHGVLASTGQWLLLTADDLPFGFSDFDQFVRLPVGTVVAIGSKAHPDSEVVRSRRRVVQSRIFKFLRAGLLQSRVGDSQGTIWVDGEWARSFALASRETGLMWTTELVLAAEQQGIRVAEVPVSLSDAHETGSSRFRLSDAWHSVVGFVRLAVYKDDYVNEVWTRTTAAPQETVPTS